MPHTAQRIAYTTAAQTLLRIIEIVIGVATLGLITRYFKPAGFGAFTTVNALLQFFVILVDFGLYLTLLRELSAQEDKTRSIANNIFTIRLLTTSALLAVSLVLVRFSPYSADIKMGTMALSIAFLSSSLIATITAIFQKQLRMVSISLVNVLSKVMTLAAVYSIVMYDLGLQSLFISYSVVGCATFITLWFILQRLPQPIRLRIAYDPVYWRHVAIKAWPIAVTTALNLVYFKADTIVLSLVQSQEHVGIYGAAYRVLEIIATFPHMFMGLILPLLTAAWVARDSTKPQALWERSFIFFASITVPLMVGAVLVGTEVMTLLAGDAFAVSGPVLGILMIATAAIFFGTLYTYLVLVIDRQRAMIKYFFVTATISLIGYCIVIPLFSYWGAAWMTVASEVLIVMSAWIVIQKEIKLNVPWVALMKIIIASIGMGVITAYLTPTMPLMSVIATSIIAYALLFLALRPVPIPELKKMLIS